MAKVRKNITLDEDLVEMAESKLGIPLSTFCNNCLKEEFKTADELSKVKKAIKEHEAALNILRSKECRLEKQKAMNIRNQTHYDEAMVTINKIVDEFGCIGELQIKNIAVFRELNEVQLVEHCKELGFKIVKSNEGPRNSKMANGSAISLMSRR